jgi:quinol monooxygenase YgiN
MTRRGGSVAKHLYAEFASKPGSEGRVAELVAGYAEHVRAEAGCLAFDPFVRSDDERRWVVFEAYIDEAAFRSHMTTEHNRAFNDEIAAHIEGGASSLVQLVAPLER